MSANSYHDGNGVHTLVAVETDGVTLINVLADATFHTLNASDGTTGSNNGPTVSRHDENHIPILMATSSADGKTPIAIYANTLGDLLTDSM